MKGKSKGNPLKYDPYAQGILAGALRKILNESKAPQDETITYDGFDKFKDEESRFPEINLREGYDYAWSIGHFAYAYAYKTAHAASFQTWRDQAYGCVGMRLLEKTDCVLKNDTDEAYQELARTVIQNEFGNPPDARKIFDRVVDCMLHTEETDKYLHDVAMEMRRQARARSRTTAR